MTDPICLEDDEDIGPEYKLGTAIGSGAYSSVYIATHVPSGKKVAIKKETGVFEDLIDCKRLLREITILRQLKHPNIVRLIDVLISPNTNVTFFNTIFLVLEIAEASLQKLVRSPVFLDALQIQTLMYNILSGISYAHATGVIHRDIKPANVLVYSDCSVRICDFGLSRSIYSLGKPEPKIIPSKKEAKGDASSEDSQSDSQSDNEEDKKEKKEEKEEKKDVPKPSKKERFSISAASSQDISVDADRTVASPFEKSGLMPTETEATRRLTSHVVTRWYRPPEIILMQDNYGPPIDVWAVGCVFAELLLMMKGNSPSVKDRKPLFPGTSCLMLSPSATGRNSMLTGSSTDQLSIVLEVLGSPTKEDLSFIKDPGVVEFLDSLPKTVKRVNFQEKFPAADKEGVDLLNKMLEFNPDKRITAEKCLTHPYFASLKKPPPDTKVPEKVILAYDTLSEIDEEKLRSLFEEELRYYAKIKEAGKFQV